MQLVDTHCHLDFPDYRDDLEDVLKRADGAGITRIIVPGTNISSSEKALELAGKYPQVFAAVGIHPHEADKAGDTEKQALHKLALEGERIVAIGEIGLDYYKKYSKEENQKKLFKECLIVAKDLDFPVILHNRNAGEDFLTILKEVGSSGLRGVVHCFSGEEDLLNSILDLGMFVSFAGNITFEKARDLRSLAKFVPVERLLLETDSPFISPEPVRGKRNEPANVKYLVDTYSQIYGLMPEDLARITTHSANRLFKLGIEEEGKVAYAIRNSLYLNITNRCTNRCTFCTRDISNCVKGHNLKLNKEPTVKEIIAAMGDVTEYEEVAFCGFGEPTLRLGAIKEVASYVKEKGVKTRLVTNGTGNLISRRAIVPELAKIIDEVSVSLNSQDEASYNKLCRPVFGGGTYPAILDFIKECKKEGLEVEITCLDIAGEGVQGCRRIAEKIGAKFRLRHFNVVG
jgi:TatD DNase family protein